MNVKEWKYFYVLNYPIYFSIHDNKTTWHNRPQEKDGFVF